MTARSPGEPTPAEGGEEEVCGWFLMVMISFPSRVVRIRAQS